MLRLELGERIEQLQRPQGLEIGTIFCCLKKIELNYIKLFGVL